MRDIKFRAWDGEKMTTALRLEIETGKIYDSGEYDDYERDCPLMQYTGLTDKNGVEIYEGDILRTGQLVGAIDKKEWRGVVEFENAAFQVDDSFLRDTEEYRFEVIGNIHANPELLQLQGI